MNVELISVIMALLIIALIWIGVSYYTAMYTINDHKQEAINARKEMDVCIATVESYRKDIDKLRAQYNAVVDVKNNISTDRGNIYKKLHATECNLRDVKDAFEKLTAERILDADTIRGLQSNIKMLVGRPISEWQTPVVGQTPIVINIKSLIGRCDVKGSKDEITDALLSALNDSQIVTSIGKAGRKAANEQDAANDQINLLNQHNKALHKTIIDLRESVKRIPQLEALLVEERNACKSIKVAFAQFYTDLCGIKKYNGKWLADYIAAHNLADICNP